jgi:Secretion system C-terminal sorting domain
MRLPIGCLCLVFLLSSVRTTAARFWVAVGPSNWNNTANWSNVSGGAGGFSVPGLADAVTFDNTRNGNCTIDVPVNVLSINVNGYAGIITQGTNSFSTVNNASFSSGTFSGGSANITIGGNFTLAGTAFSSTSAILEFDGNAAFTSLTFTHNNGTARFKATGGTTVISGTSPAFYQLEFSGQGFSYNITSAGNITVSNSLNLTGALFFNLNTGNIDVSGDINVTNTAAGCGGTGQVNIIGGGVQNFNGSTVAGAGGLPKLTINKASGTLNLTNFPTSSNAFTYSAGTINAGTSTYCFTDGNTSPYTISGSPTFNNIEFLSITNQTFTVANTLTTSGDLLIAGTARVTINTGNINVNGNIVLTNTSATGGGSAAINIIGTGNEVMDGTALAISQSLLPFINVNKTSGTLTLEGNISESQDWTYIGGTVDAGSFSSNVIFGGNGLNITSAGMSFYNVLVTGNTITLLNNLTVSNNLTITGGHIAPGANTINLAGNWNDYGTGGYAEATSTVNFNGSALQTITSPGGENFTNFTVNNSAAGIQLINNTTIATTLTMTQGNINLNGNALTLGISVANNGTLVYTSGTIIGTGGFTRWFKTGIIANGSVTGLFPVGTSADYRPFFVSAPAAGPTTGGTISVNYTDATTNTNVAITDGAFTVAVRKDLNWAVTTNTLAGGTYNLDVQGTGYGLIGAVSDLRLTLVNSVSGTAGVNAGTTLNPQINRTGLTLANLNNTFYIGSINSVSTPLPITLISFKAFAENGEVELEWTTSSETDNAYFTIQRSRDGLGWDNIQKITGAGTSANDQSYTAFDQSPYDGVSYYRLMQTDLDGKQTNSFVVSVTLGNKPVNISVYPNPARDHIKIDFPSNGRYEVDLLNIAGQSMNNHIVTTSDNLILNLSGLKSGIYIVRIIHEGTTESKKISVY